MVEHSELQRGDIIEIAISDIYTYSDYRRFIKEYWYSIGTRFMVGNITQFPDFVGVQLLYQDKLIPTNNDSGYTWVGSDDLKCCIKIKE